MYEDLAKFQFSEKLFYNAINDNLACGLVGLKNLGNTCFMNSALQCLSHTLPLTYYFLSGKYKDDVNKTNKLGMGGKMAFGYAKLLKQMWLGTGKVLNPSDFRFVFVSFARKFAGFMQHDSHEMLTYMLDAVHEDLNRVQTKPFVELDEKKDDESEQEAADRWWQNKLRRDDSIMHDTFCGQFKSKITCPDCNRQSITFDPFTCVGLSIPSSHEKTIPVVFFRNESNNYSIEKAFFSPESTVSDFLSKMKKRNNILLDLVMVITKNKDFVHLCEGNERMMKIISDNKNEIVVHEIDMEDKSGKIVLNPFRESKGFFFNTSKEKLGYPKVLAYDEKDGKGWLHKEAFKFCRPVLIDYDKFTYEKHIKNYNSEDYINQEINKFFENYDKDSVPFTFYNDYSQSHNFLCQHCKTYNCENCEVKLQKKMTISEYVQLGRNNIFSLKINWYEKSRQIQRQRATDKFVEADSKNVTLIDCLTAFSKEEQLEENNEWYCNVCKKHKRAYKKIDIFRLPNVIIFQLKRFKGGSSGLMSYFSSGKINTYVDYPDEIDMGEILNKEERMVYELFAVNQHYGGTSGGHYTAVCKNEEKWFKFDDSFVSKFNEGKDSSAYLLFYKLKDQNK